MHQLAQTYRSYSHTKLFLSSRPPKCRTFSAQAVVAGRLAADLQIMSLLRYARPISASRPVLHIRHTTRVYYGQLFSLFVFLEINQPSWLCFILRSDFTASP
jgi:hypothetical protein